MRVAISGAQGFLELDPSGVAGVGRRGVILKVINNIAKTHAGSLDLVIGSVGIRYKWRNGVFLGKSLLGSEVVTTRTLSRKQP